ncbi:MAG: carboxypeptidase regulatory-like domain-containing protein [Clostridia bacterium]|nr:carboxypeptidase regulatory-like domain-containing protein [Clostridia bacterium]
MHKIENRLRFTGEAEATVYFCTDGTAAITYTSDRALTYRLADAWNSEISVGCAEHAELPLPQSGNYRLTFSADMGGTAVITLHCEDNVLPYIMPGVGVLWEHGGIFPMLLDRDQPHTLWLLSADDDSTDTSAVIKGIDYGEDVSITVKGELFTADWYPKMTRPWFWHSAELPNVALMRIDLPPCKSDVRFTAYNRVVTALEEPKHKFTFGALIPRVTDAQGNAIDARVEVFVGNERVALSDRFAHEDTPIHLPLGRYKLRASHGIFWSEAEVTADVTLDTTEVTFTLNETVKLPNGWLLGELHTHSSLEDATLFPKHVMRAARACGRNFCFMTDKDVGLLDKFGLHECDLDGNFLAFPGQEIMCHELHTNVLNPSHRIHNPEAEDLGAVNRDIEVKTEKWLCEYRKMKKERPCLIMHNHPEHRTEVMKRGKPYFRSWWVSDMFGDDYHLVENCGYTGWFDRLNRGRRIYAAWTGDGHDCTLMYPGKEGVCVYTGGELSAEAVISALESGRFFSCRAPGAFIDISRAEANGIRVIAKSPIEIEFIEIIADGQVSTEIPGNRKREIDIICELPANTHWCLARLKLCGGDWNATLHSFTPFMEAGFAAFTNPLFLW